MDSATQVQARKPKVLFVTSSEEDTRFLTRDLPVEVIHTSSLDRARTELKDETIAGVFVDVASAAEIEKAKSSKSVPVVALAGLSELPLAIEQVKKGAKGFLVKGISDSASVLKLMKYASC